LISIKLNFPSVTIFNRTREESLRDKGSAGAFTQHWQNPNGKENKNQRKKVI